MTKLGLTDVQDMVDILNKKSGLLGLTNGLSSDMRDIQSNLDKPEVQTAYNIFIDRIRKYIGSYVTVMNGVDAIVFTAG
ncbi:acetate kinase, partial [Escherichia coli]